MSHINNAIALLVALHSAPSAEEETICLQAILRRIEDLEIGNIRVNSIPVDSDQQQKTYKQSLAGDATGNSDFSPGDC